MLTEKRRGKEDSFERLELLSFVTRGEERRSIVLMGRVRFVLGPDGRTFVRSNQNLRIINIESTSAQNNDAQSNLSAKPQGGMF